MAYSLSPDPDPPVRHHHRAREPGTPTPPLTTRPVPAGRHRGATHRQTAPIPDDVTSRVLAQLHIVIPSQRNGDQAHPVPPIQIWNHPNQISGGYTRPASDPPRADEAFLNTTHPPRRPQGSSPMRAYQTQTENAKECNPSPLSPHFPLPPSVATGRSRGHERARRVGRASGCCRTPKGVRGGAVIGWMAQGCRGGGVERNLVALGGVWVSAGGDWSWCCGYAYLARCERECLSGGWGKLVVAWTHA